MLKFLIVIFALIFSGYAAPAQGSGNTGSLKPKEKIYTDTFKGKILKDNSSYYSTLILQRCRYCDDGKFILKEAKMEAMPDSKPIETNGDWTVLKGDAADDNATVVEIDGKKDTLYFLRLKNGDLQKLDGHLREIKPAGRYVMKKG